MVVWCGVVWCGVLCVVCCVLCVVCCVLCVVCCVLCVVCCVLCVVCCVLCVVCCVLCVGVGVGVGVGVCVVLCCVVLCCVVSCVLCCAENPFFASGPQNFPKVPLRPKKSGPTKGPFRVLDEAQRLKARGRPCISIVRRALQQGVEKQNCIERLAACRQRDPPFCGLRQTGGDIHHWNMVADSSQATSMSDTRIDGESERDLRLLLTSWQRVSCLSSHNRQSST